MPRYVGVEAARLQGALWTPAVVRPWLPYWIDTQARGVTLSGSTVSTVPDQSLRGVALANGLNTAWSEAGLNLRPAVSFSTGWFYQSSTVSPSCTSFIAAAVATLNSGATASARLLSYQNTGGAQDWNNTSSCALMTRNGAGIATQFNSSTIGGVTVSYDTPFLVVVEHNGSNFAWRLNGAQVGSRAGSTLSFGSGIFGIGSFWGGNNSAARYLGLVGEQVFVAGRSEAPLIETIEGYLAWKWGLQGGLAASHPHRNAPPLIGA